MKKIVVDQKLQSKLGNLTEPLKFYDEKGLLLGRFLPAYDPALYEGLESPISKEELERRRQEKGKGKTYTTAEVLAHLETLT